MVDLYQDITDRIIEALEHGVIPWKKPWCAVGKGAFNRISGRPYSLLNQMILRHGGEYATYDQWISLGGRINKGAKAEKVIFWKKIDPEEQEDTAEDIRIHERKKPKYVLRYYNVFPFSSVTGVSPLKLEEENYEHDRIKKAEELVAGVSKSVLLPDHAKAVSISIGIAAYNGYENNYSDLFKKADTAMYQAKADPENRFYIYE